MGERCRNGKWCGNEGAGAEEWCGDRRAVWGWESNVGTREWCLRRGRASMLPVCDAGNEKVVGMQNTV